MSENKESKCKSSKLNVRQTRNQNVNLINTMPENKESKCKYSKINVRKQGVKM